ncbi:hypothetical protein WJX72_000129 [[Myrmecia] bisecta]|uniref:Cyclin A n=1 Tax=[Myrmecia] bisecta TaxID=41462 RepID=A0AAW1PJ00_9CHLO
MAAYARGRSFKLKQESPVGWSTEEDQALTRSSSVSTDTAFSSDEQRRLNFLERSCSVTSTAATSRLNQIPQLGGQGFLHRTNSTGSKRSYDVSDNDEDTPTKRPKELDDSLCMEECNTWSWGRSPAVRHRTRLSDCSSDRVDSFRVDSAVFGPASTSYADLCCGESDAFIDSQARKAQFSQPQAASGRSTRRKSRVSYASSPLPALDFDLLEMIRCLYQTERQLLADPDYMLNHGQLYSPKHFLDPSMRMIAVSWLVEVACEYRLHQETLFLATALIDRFLTHSKAVPRSNLQLVAVACMLVAAKHEEEVHPSVADFVSIADNCFRHNDLLKMESLVLESLSFRINTPTSHTFLSLFKQGSTHSPRAAAMASYLTELALLEYDLLAFPPSLLAAAALLLSEAYDTNMKGLPRVQQMSGFSAAELRVCMEELLALHQRAFDTHDINNPYMAVKDKYRNFAWSCVAQNLPLECLPEQMFCLPNSH